MLAVIFHSTSLSHSHSTQSQGYPQRGFWLLLKCYELPIGYSKQGLPQNFYICTFYMPLILQLRPPLSVISLQHQPLISPNSNQNIEPAILQLLAQQKKNTTTNYPGSSSLTTKNCPHSTCQLASFSFKSHLLSSSNLLLFPPFLHPQIALGHPSRATTLSHIMHRQ